MIPDLTGKTRSALSLWAGLSVTEFERLSQPWLRVDYPAGHCLYTAVETGEFLYLVVAGQVALRDERGETVTILGPGAILGQMSLLGICLAPYTAHTAVETDLYLLSRAHAEQMMKQISQSVGLDWLTKRLPSPSVPLL